MARGSELPEAVRQRLQRLFLEAKPHFDARRWDEAIARFREIVRLDPNNPQAHHDLGMMWLFSGRPDEAALSLARALELKPLFDSALGHLATVLLQLGREHEALLAYRKLGRSADDPAARVLFGPGAEDGGPPGGSGEGASRSPRSGAADGQGAGSPRGAPVGPRDVRGGRGPSQEGDRGFPGRLSATGPGEAHDGGRPPAHGSHAWTSRWASSRRVSAHQRSLRSGQGLRRFGRLRRGDAALRGGKPAEGDVGAPRSRGAGGKVRQPYCGLHG